MKPSKLFVYGTLKDQHVREQALGEPIEGRKHEIEGFEKELGEYSNIRPGKGKVKGQLLSLTPGQLKKLDEWEKENYTREQILPGIDAYVMKESPLHYQTGGYTPTRLTDTAFIPTYVGTPLEDAQKYGTDLLNTYKQNIADLTKLDIANAQRKVLEGDAPESAKYDAELKAQFQDMARKGDYENMTAQVNELARRHFNNKDLKAWAESRANADERDKLVMNLRAKGINPWFDKDPRQHQTIVIDPETGEKHYNIYKSTAESPLEHQTKRSQIWSVIKPDAKQLSSADVAATMQAVPGYILTGEWKGISGTGKGEKIAQLTEHAMREYMSTPEYDQELRHEIELRGGGEEAKAEAEAEIRKRVVSEGILRTFSEVNPQYLRDHSLEDAIHRAKLGEKPFPAEDEALPGVHPADLLGFDLTNFDPATDPAKMKTPDQIAAGTGIVSTALAHREKKKAMEQKTAQSQAFQTAAMAGATIFGDPKKASEQGSAFYDTPEAFQYAQKYAQMMKERMIFPSFKSYAVDEDPTMGERRTEQLRNSIQSRIIWDFETGKQIDTSKDAKVNPEFMALLDNNLNNLVAVGSVNPKNPYYRVTGNARFADAEVAQIRNTKTGDVKQVLISKPEGFYRGAQGRRNLIQNVIWDKLALTPGTTQDFNVEGIPISAIVIPDPGDPSGSSDQLKIWKIGENEFPEGYVVPAGYDGLVNVIDRMLQ